MDEVIVTAIAPMRMNGDTLEFNADAFKLDSNSTAEDFMRRLPGFTVMPFTGLPKTLRRKSIRSFSHLTECFLIEFSRQRIQKLLIVLETILIKIKNL